MPSKDKEQSRKTEKKYKSRTFHYFRSHWDLQDLLIDLKFIPNIKTHTLTKELIVEELTSNALDELINFFSKFHLLQHYIEEDDQKLRKVILKWKIPVSNITFSQLKLVLNHWYSCQTNNLIRKVYKTISNKLLRPYLDTFKIVSDLTHPLRQLFEILKTKPYHLSLQDSLILIKESKYLTQFIINKETINPIYISLNRILHILRHPSNGKAFLIEFLEKIKLKTLPPVFLISELPLIDQPLQKLNIITILDTFESKDQNSIKMELGRLPPEILDYWLTLSAIILRNIASGLLQISKIQNLSPEFKDLYITFKGKFIVFIDSCRNNDLVKAYKFYDELIRNKGDKKQFLRNYEFNVYNRGALLESRLRMAQKEFNNNQTSRTLRKRVNLRLNRLKKFLNLNLTIFKSFIKEALELSKATGNYKNLISLNKEFQTRQSNSSNNYAESLS